LIKGRSTEELIQIVAAGGGLDLRAPGRSTDDLIRIAAAASGKGAQLIISPVGRSTEDLIRIGAAGKGCVLFQTPMHDDD
jgi:hypothetical protein